MRFDQVRVPAWSVIGELGGQGGMSAAMRQIGGLRLQVAATAVGTARWALAHTRGVANQPHRTGSTLAGREGVQLRYATMWSQCTAARAMLYRTAALLDGERVDAGAGGVDEISEVDGATLLMATKVFCTEMCGFVVDGCVQLCGGNAIVVGHPLEAAYRRVRQWRFAEGASDLLLIKVAKKVLEARANVPETVGFVGLHVPTGRPRHKSNL